MSSDNPYRSPAITVPTGLADTLDVPIATAIRGIAVDPFRGATGRLRAGFRLTLLATLLTGVCGVLQSLLVWFLSPNLFTSPFAQWMSVCSWGQMAASLLLPLGTALLASASPRGRRWPVGWLTATIAETVLRYLPWVLSLWGGAMMFAGSLLMAGVTITLHLLSAIFGVLSCCLFANDAVSVRRGIMIAGFQIGFWLLAIASLVALQFQILPALTQTENWNRILGIVALPIWTYLIWQQVRLNYRALSAVVLEEDGRWHE